MKKSKVLLFTVAFFSLLLLILGFGKLDYQVSLNLINHESIWAQFFNMFGEIPFTVGLLAFVTIMYRGHKRTSKLKSIILGIISYPFMFLFSYLVIIMPIRYIYEFKGGMPADRQVLAVILAMVLFSIVVKLIKKFTPDQFRKLRKPILFAFVLIVTEVVLVNVLKMVWARPRMRSLESFEQFKYWWQVSGPMSSEEFKSFPSGHTANAFVLLALTRFVPANKEKLRRNTMIFAILFASLTAISRVVLGAHFMSDVIFAGLLVLGLYLLYDKVFSNSKVRVIDKTDSELAYEAFIESFTQYVQIVKEKGVKAFKADIRKNDDKKDKKAQKKGLKLYRRRKRLPYVLGVFTLILILVSIPGVKLYKSATAPLTDEQAATYEVSKDLAIDVMAEGIVLLKNEENTLPLNKPVNIFGAASAKPVYSGGGAGAINSMKVVDLFTALSEEGIEYNEALKNIYSNYVFSGEADDELYIAKEKTILDVLFPNIVSFLQREAKEMTPSNILVEIIEDAVAYSDTAIYVIGRSGMETFDLTLEDIRLSKDEEATIEMINNNFEHVIVIMNTCNTMELGFLEKYENIDSVLWIGAPGQFGTYAVARTLKGEINPSGKLVDTYVYNVEDNPAVLNTGDFQYVDENGLPLERYFTNNLEGIYVGYRYYETFLSDEKYDENVQFPFGHGLSYTEFAWEPMGMNVEGDTVSVEVKVTNTGDKTGKEVIQLYYTPPYYEESGIEKSEMVLAGFAKTGMLESGQSEVVTVDFKLTDMASYDEKKVKTWILEHGDYEIHISRNVHEIVTSYDLIVEEDMILNTDSKTGAVVTNVFEDSSGDLTYLSRRNPDETMPTAPNDDDYLVPVEVLDTIDYEAVKSDFDEPVTGKDHGIVLSDLKDLDYDDSLWGDFIDQFTVEEMIQLSGDGGYWSVAIERLGIPETIMYDGPACIRSFLEPWSTVAFPISNVLASTWNVDIANQMGVAMGNESVAYGVNAVYAPSINIHRSPLGGRNFEYYSEDPLISGKMSSGYTKGLQSTGTVAILKHFVANDQETNRAKNGLYVWVTEQALREIYMKPFEIAVKEGNAYGIMSAFNRIGTTWAGGSYPLLTQVLRNEWGFNGLVITDAGVAGQGNHFDSRQGIDAGNNIFLASPIRSKKPNKYEKELALEVENDPVGTIYSLKKTVHDICYYVLQTNEVE